jgi:glycosyltransferase involved in cell wall biosynthesis
VYGLRRRITSHRPGLPTSAGEAPADSAANAGRRQIPLSAFVICQDEERYLGNCIESLACCAEIVIVDSGSTDGTEALVDRYRAAGWPVRFVRERWRGYAGQKQFAMDLCTQPWVFNIDADERFDRALVAALPDLLAAPADVVGWRIARRPYLIGAGYTPAHVHERRNLRLIRRGRGAYDLAQTVHEGIVPNGPVKESPKGSLLHYRPLPIDEQILKENKYSSLKADQIVKAGGRPRLAKLVVNPPVYFLRLYLRTGLWRCGFAGFIQAMTGAVYSFLTEAKIYQRTALARRPNHDDMDGMRPAVGADERTG